MASRVKNSAVSLVSTCDTSQRLKLLERLGGLTETSVQNSEWLYMLGEDTRQSLAIEGYFATELELKGVLTGRKTAPEIQNYYRVAQSIYDQALQGRREGDLMLYMALVRHVHSELFRELSAQRGEFRRGAIRIQGAKVTPPAHDLEAYLRSWVSITLDFARTLEPIAALARSHALFESIHPFEDGNGRAGRILLNYLSISLGLPPIVIKGFTAAERTRYYAALELADAGFHDGFPPPNAAKLKAALERGDFGRLEMLLCEGVLPRLDALIAGEVERREGLRDFKTLSAELGVQEVTLRQWVTRGKLIAVKRGKKLFSHASLRLER